MKSLFKRSIAPSGSGVRRFGAGLAGGLLLATAPLAADELVWARYGDIDSLDPHRATSTLSMQVWDQIYDTLLAFDDDGMPQPNLAHSWDISDDGLSYTFHLEEGVLCHDGSPFGAEDVKFTIDRAFGDNPSLTRASWGPITGVAVIDPLTVRVDLERTFGAFLPFLADSFSSMICAVNADDPQFGSRTAIGTGPFRLVNWVQGSVVTLERNDDYRNFGKPVENAGPVHLERLIIRTIPEAQTRLAALRTGEVHIAEPPFDDIPDIQSRGDLELMLAENTGQNVFWQFTTSRAPFDDLRARQAVAHATDPEMAIEIIYGGTNQREWCPIAAGVFGNDQDFCRQHGYEYDPARARELLSELGFGPNNRLRTTMFVWTGGNRQLLAEIFQAQLAEAWIDASIEILDIGTMNARVRADNEDADATTPGSFNMMTWGWYDPDILHALWHSPGAYAGYTSDELDAMLELTRQLTDEAERLAAVRDVIQYLMEQAIHVGLYTPGWEWIFATRPEVQGFKVGAFLHPMFQDVRLSD